MVEDLFRRFEWLSRLHPCNGVVSIRPFTASVGGPVMWLRRLAFFYFFSFKLMNTDPASASASASNHIDPSILTRLNNSFTLHQRLAFLPRSAHDFAFSDSY